MPLQSARNAKSSGSDLTSGTAFLSKLRPRKRIPKPISASPESRTLGRLKKIIATPMPTQGRAIFARLNLKPRKATIQNVVVVPRLAPMIMPIDSVSVRSRAFTKLTIITVVALEDCTNVVMSVPLIMPDSRLRVILLISARRPSPETFCRPSLITFIP